VTSLIGLVLAKRRKYGGYIVHLGIALMFVGFAGKAYGRMTDRTLEKPAAGEASKFQFGGYTFVYDDIFHTSDENKDAVTAQVSVYQGNDKVATVFPAKWDYHKGEGQMTSEVAIKVRGNEDVYVVLTGFDLDSKLGNFRVYINPLILWVWIGFLVMALGTLVCLIPQSLVDRMQWKPRSPIGRAADVGILAALAFGAVLGIASQAQAAGPAGTEHVPAGMGMGQAGGGAAAQNRPQNAITEKAMKELICPCGCARQDIFGCDCQTAADLRGKVIGIMQGYDLNTPEGKKQGYDAVMKQFVSEYGEMVLATPRSQFPWLLPSVAAVGALGLLVIVGRRWMKKGHGPDDTQKPTTPTAADEAYADKLDDELAETD
jgi:cytochrome c-type biogenesis protein CcmF